MIVKSAAPVPGGQIGARTWRVVLAWLFAASLLAVGSARGGETATAATTQPPIETYDQLWALSQTGHTDAVRARFRVFVACYFPDWKTLWVLQGNDIHYLDAGPAPLPLKSGEWVDLDGYALPANQMMVWSKTKITPVAGLLPPKFTAFTDRMTQAGANAAFYAQIEGFVDQQAELDLRHFRLNVVTGGASASVFIRLETGEPVPQLLGARVRLTGVLSIKADVNTAEPKSEFWCASPKSIEVTGFLASDPRFDAPAIAIEDLSRAEGRLVHVVGKVRSREPGRSMLLRDETGQLTVMTRQIQEFKEGERVDAVGVVHRQGVVTELRDALVRGTGAIAAPPQVTFLLRLTDQVRAVGPAECAKGVEARIDGVVTWSSPSARYFFIKDAAGGLKIFLPAGQNATAPIVGSGVMVRGRVVEDNFTPSLAATDIRPGENIGINDPATCSYEEAMTGGLFAEWVQMQGYVRAVQPDANETRVEVIAPGGEFTAVLPPGTLPDLVGAIVRLRGVCDAIANERRQLTAFRLLVPSPENVTVVEPAATDVFALPMDSIGNLLRYNPASPLNRRAQVSGVVLLHAPGRALYVEDGPDTLTVLTRQTDVFKPGDRVAIVGLPGHDGNRLIMREAVARRLSAGAPPAPTDLPDIRGLDVRQDGHLVRTTGVLLSREPVTDGTRMQLQQGSTIFSARLEGPTMPPIEIGSTLSVTGVYRLEFNETRQARGFVLNLRSPADAVVLSSPPRWTVARIVWISAALLALVIVVAIWGAVLSRKNELLELAQAELRRANEELEARVQTRTAALTLEVENRRDSEATLAAERLLLRTLIDNLPVYLYVKDATGRFVIDNLPHAQLLGASACADVVGKTEADFWPEAVAREYQQTDAFAMNGGKALGEREETFILQNARRWHSTTKVPLRDAAGNITGLIAIAQDITARKEVEKDREVLHRQLLDTSRRAGMAEVASGVLHNIGNVLNSVNISAGVATDIIGRSRLEKLGVVRDLLASHREDLGAFFASDKRAQRLPEYVAALCEQLQNEHAELRKELATLHQNIDHIKEVVAMQQTYAKITGVTERIPAQEVVEQAIQINAEALAHDRIEVIRDVQANPTIVVDRHKVLQVLVNLISNAKHACDDGPSQPKRVIVTIRGLPGSVEIAIRDNGVGIPAENLTRIFSHGFTTRKNGHGFGLHSGALTAKELGGSLHVSSDGPGCGATFTLTVPLMPVATEAA